MKTAINTFRTTLLALAMFSAGAIHAQVAPRTSAQGIHTASWEWTAAESTIRAQLAQRLGLSEREALELRSEVVTPHARHLQYTHRIAGKQVLFSGVNVHLYPERSLYQAYHISLADRQLEEGKGAYLFPEGNRLIPVERILNREVVRPVWVFSAGDGTEYFRAERYRYVEDTIARLGVFQVNPVNSAGATYGGFFIDNKDSNNLVLQGQIDTVTARVQFRNDSFFLDHPKLHFAEISAPYHHDDYGSDSAHFLHTRDQQRFEAVNVYYHITRFIQYLDTLGFGNLALPIDVDVHGINGSDNSQFDPQDYTIEFGDGGVDDAEDGEVVIHEFVHSLSTTANYTVNNSRERDAMEEGNCDYLSKSYSRSVNDHNSYKVFSWDGHNAFWSGFIINSPDHYPEDLKNSKDGDRDLWSSMLMCIHDDIGREATDSLVLEHMYYQTPKASMLDMAEALLLVDSLLFDRRHYGPIKECLVSRGLSSYSVGVEDLEGARHLQWFNSYGFAQGNASMVLRLEGDFDYEIHNALGQRVAKGQATDELTLHPAQFRKGYYSILVNLDGHRYTGRFIRL